VRPVLDTVSCKHYAVSVSDFLTAVDSQLVRGSTSRRHLLYCLTVGRVCWNSTGMERHRKADVFGLGSWGVRRKWILGLEMVPDGPEW